MSPISQPTFTPVASTVTIVDAANIKITNLTLTTAGNEYSHALQTNLKQLRVRCRENATVRYSFVSGDTDTTYWTIFPGCTDNITELSFNGTIYVQANKNSVTLEIMELY